MKTSLVPSLLLLITLSPQAIGGRRHPSRALESTVAGSEKTATIRVAGNELNDPSGHTVRLQGVNVPSLEWSNTGDGRVLKAIGAAFDDWKANAVRLPLSQDRWFGKAPGQADGGDSYRKIVDEAVNLAASRGDYLILDLHWSDAGAWGERIAQHKMPDRNSVRFWRDAARRYANRPAVLFDLYNEPHDVTWEVWRNGGAVEEKESKTGKTVRYSSPGLQRLLQEIRKAGARNVVVAGGLDWAYDLSGVTRGGALADPGGDGVIYSAHIYPWKQGWDRFVTPASERYPVLIGEVGCQPDPRTFPETWAPRVLKYIEQHRLSWTAWAFHPSASPCLILNWNDDPTPYWGIYVKEALARSHPD